MQWSKSKQYDTGNDPSVSINNQKVIVETHYSEGSTFDPGPKLWYRLGKLTSDTTIDWGDSHKYDTGLEPSVAINDLGQVVEVHLTDNINQVDLWYRVGKVKGDVIEWGDSQKYDTGGHPAVAINNNGTVVEVHDSGIGVSTPTLWYRVGQIGGDKIDWKGKAKFDDGYEPDVAIDDNDNVVEVHGVTAGFDLWYHVGTINGDQIEWGSSHRLADGRSPSIAIGKAGAVLEGYGKPTPNIDEFDLLYRTGVISGREIDWDKDGEKFDKGQLISVALSSAGDAVEVHQSENAQTLWYSVGRLAATGTDDALYSGTKCYFFSGNQYIRVTRGDTGPGTVDPGYPAPISNWGWGSFGEKGVDAALYSGTKCYFFAGDQYIRVTRGDTGPGTVDSGYPAPISNWGWGSFGDKGIDTALYDGTKCYFFAGDQYIRVTRGDTGPGTVDPGYPAPISNLGWGSFGEKGIDAALYSGTKCYFFAGDQYIRVTLGEDGPGTIDPGYPKSISQWGWPASFADLWVNNAGLPWR